MPPEHHQIEIERIGEYVQRNSCPRRFKLDLDGRKLARELPFFTRLINPVDPVLQASGSRMEREWEKSLSDAGMTSVASKLSLEGPNIPWDAFTRVLGEAKRGDLLYAREVEIHGMIGDFLLRGRMDFLLLSWDGERPLLKVVECKASRKDRTYHRIQLSIYLALVRQAASAGELSISGIRIGQEDVQGFLVRLNDQGRAEDILSAPSLNLDVEMEDIRRMLGVGGQLSKICDSPLADLPYQLDGKCDSCVMNVYCLPEGAREHRLELLGLTSPATRALVEAGVSDLDALAKLDPTGDAARSIRRSPSFNERLESVIEKAKARLSTLPGGGGYEVVPLPDVGLGGLPEHIIEGQRLLRCYISVNYDYSENRVMAIAAHVTNSDGKLETRWEGRERIPGTFERYKDDYRGVQGRDVVVYQPTPWIGDYSLDNEAETSLISSFFRELVMALTELGGGEKAPVHLYFWSKGDITALLEGCTRCSSGLLDAMTNLLGCREPLEQMIYTVLQDEVDSRYALGWTGSSSVVVSSLKWFGRRYHWTRDVDGKPMELDRLFRAGLFDFVEHLSLGKDGKWLRSEGRGAPTERFETRCRFNDSLPVPYLHAIWGTLPLPNTPGLGSRVQQMLRQYHEAGHPEFLKELLRARVHSLRWIEEGMGVKNRFLRKPPMDIQALASFDLNVTDPIRAALDVLRLDHHVDMNDWMAKMRSPPRDRILGGEMMPLTGVIVITERDDNGWDNEFLIGHLDLDRYGESLSDFRNRLTLDVGATVRAVPYDGNADAVQPLNDFLHHGENGRIEILDLETGLVRVALMKVAGTRYVLQTSHEIRDGDLVTLDPNPSDFVANRADDWLSNHGGSRVASWFDLSRPDVPSAQPIPSEIKQKMSSALSHLAINGFRLGGDQMSAIIDGFQGRIQLLQGPPGTGKTVTTALAVLARTHISGPGGITVVATNTHYAIDRFMEELDARHTEFMGAMTAVGLHSCDLVVHRLGKDMDKNKVAAIMASTKDRHLLVGGTINEVLKFASHAEKNIQYGRSDRKFEANTLTVDEASMMAFPYLMALSTLLSAEGRIMLSGDHRQLSPIFKHDWESEDRPPVIKYHPHYSAYDAAATIAVSSGGEGRIIRSALDTTYRLPWEIREIISGVYREDGITLTGIKPQRSRSLTVGTDPWSTVWAEGGVYLIVHDEDRSKNFNPYEAELVEKVLDSGNLEPRAAAVMTPHRAQRTLLRDKLERFSGQVDIIDTVEKLQGGERPTIIVSGTQSDPSSIANTADFILNLNRSNVIFSRAKERLVVICSRSLLESVPADNKQYQTARLWKKLRDFCGHQLQTASFRGHCVSLYTHSPSPEDYGAIVDVQEVGGLQEEVPAFVAVEKNAPIVRKRGVTPGIMDKLLGPPPIGEIAVDGSNVAWNGQSGAKPSGDQLIACYRDLMNEYSFSKVYVLVGPGLRHHMGLEEYERMTKWFEDESMKVGRRIFLESPPEAYDDRFTISFAINDDLLILTNDRYRDIVDSDEDLKFETSIRSVRYLFIEGKLRIGQWPQYFSS